MLPASQSWSTSRPSAARGSLANQAQESRRGSLSNTTVIYTNPHATPPRQNGTRPLPPSSPSSERLRRIAPSPIRIIPRSRLQYSPGSPVPRIPPISRLRRSDARQASFDLRAVENLVEAEETLEDDAAEWSSSVQRYLASQGVSTSRPLSESSIISVPIILDIEGRRSAPADQRVPSNGANADVESIPDELRDSRFLNVEPARRASDEGMTPARFMHCNYVPEVLVDFNTDVFSPRPQNETSAAPHADEYGPHDRSPSPAPEADANVVSMRDSIASASVWSRSSASSFYAPERRDTDFGGYMFPPPGPANRPLPVPVEQATEATTPARRGLVDVQPEPSLGPHRVGSSDTVFSDLITPAHVTATLPQQAPGTSSPPNPRHLRFRPLDPAPEEVEPESSGGLGLNTGRGSIDSEHDRAIQFAGGTPRLKRRKARPAKSPPVPAIPVHYAKTPVIKVTPSILPSFEVDSTFGDIPPKVLEQSDDEEYEDWPEDLATFDRKAFVDIHVDQDKGPSYCVRMPFRRLTRPDYWRSKEDEALVRACRFDEDPPRPQPFQQTGAVVFGQSSRGRDSWILDNHSKADTPVLHSITADDNCSRSYAEQVELNIEKAGIHRAYGFNKYGEVDWVFEYLVKYTHKGSSWRIMEMGRHVFPMFLYATTTFFDRAEKAAPSELKYKGYAERIPTPTYFYRHRPSLSVAPPQVAESPMMRVASAPVLTLTESSPGPAPSRELEEEEADIARQSVRARSDTITSSSGKQKQGALPKLFGTVKRVIAPSSESPPGENLIVPQASGSGSGSGSSSLDLSELGAEQDQDTPTKSHISGGLKGFFGKLASKSKGGSRPSSSRGHSPLSAVMTINYEGSGSSPALSRVDSQTQLQTDSTSNHSGPSFLQRLTGKSRNSSRPSSRSGTPCPPAVLDESEARGSVDGNTDILIAGKPASDKRPRSHSLLGKFGRPFTPPSASTPDGKSPPLPDQSTPTPLRVLKSIKSLSSLNPNAPSRKGKDKAPPLPSLPKLPATAAPTSRAGPSKMVLAQQTPMHHVDHPFITELRALPPPIPGSQWTHVNPQPTHYIVRRPAPEQPKPKTGLVPREAYTSSSRPSTRPSTSPLGREAPQGPPPPMPIRAPAPVGRALPPPPRSGIRKRPSTANMF